jgi:hypothetical protein
MMEKVYLVGIRKIGWIYPKIVTIFKGDEGGLKAATKEKERITSLFLSTNVQDYDIVVEEHNVNESLI